MQQSTDRIDSVPRAVTRIATTSRLKSSRLCRVSLEILDCVIAYSVLVLCSRLPEKEGQFLGHSEYVQE